MFANDSSRRIKSVWGSFVVNRSLAAASVTELLDRSIGLNDIHEYQFMGRDEMFGLYEWAHVNSVRAELTFSVSNAETEDPHGADVLINCWVDTNNTVSANAVTSLERCHTHQGKSEFFVAGDGLVGATPVSLFYDMTFVPQKVCNLTIKEPDTWQNTGGTSLTADAKMYPHFEVWNTSAAVAITAAVGFGLAWKIALTYDVTFFNPKEIVPSSHSETEHPDGARNPQECPELSGDSEVPTYVEVTRSSVPSAVLGVGRPSNSTPKLKFPVASR